MILGVPLFKHIRVCYKTCHSYQTIPKLLLTSLIRVYTISYNTVLNMLSLCLYYNIFKSTDKNTVVFL